MSLNFSNNLSRSELLLVQETLLEWGKVNFRPFPWREESASDFEVFISEFMLRKTRAENVLPVFNRFTTRFHNFYEVLSAEPTEIENEMKPLGLFRVRSRAIVEASKTIVDKYGGRVPDDEGAIKGLPNCGRYIANAVLCFYFNIDKPLVDTNIQRYLVRHFGFQKAAEIHKADYLWDFMSKLIPAGNARNFNYSILDYCSAICTSRKCKCEESGVW